MQIFKTKQEVRDAVARWKGDGARVAGVPTMGALHEGHLSLVDLARDRSDKVIATIFVNPIQFAPTEDFDTYPRRLEQDSEMLASRGCSAIFAPARDHVFPADFSTHIRVDGVTSGYCGTFRPHFFEGVATIVTKLLMILAPDAAVFGEKDYQQLVTIRRLVRDLDIPVEIVGGPTVREPDGLAMSSRNQYLSAQERAIAPALHRTLRAAREKLENVAPPEQVSAWATSELLASGFSKVDYFQLADAASLEPVTAAGRPGRLLAAAWLGKTRLIDNIAVD